MDEIFKFQLLIKQFQLIYTKETPVLKGEIYREEFKEKLWWHLWFSLFLFQEDKFFELMTHEDLYDLIFEDYKHYSFALMSVDISGQTMQKYFIFLEFKIFHTSEMR